MRRVHPSHLKIEREQHTAFDMTLSEGSWSMNVVGKDPSNPNNPFWWSQQFRKLLGYRDESDFPNTLNSWSDKLHPEDKQKALNAFAAHVSDYRGIPPFISNTGCSIKTGNIVGSKRSGKPCVKATERPSW